MIEIINQEIKENKFEFLNLSNDFTKINFPNKEKIHYLSNNVIFPKEVSRYSINGKSLFVQSLHTSFDNHIPFIISPDSIWYIISYEVATHIRLNREKYRELFTSKVEKDKMEVRADWLIYGYEHNDWASAIDLFRTPISEKVPSMTQQLLMLDFSTSTDNTKLAMLAIFMDMLSHYYEFTVFTRCGIPRIGVTGTSQDWNKIIRHTEMIGDVFKELKPYTEKSLCILKEILLSVENGIMDIEFWNSIYKYQSMSGGDLITGWINDLFIYDYSQKQPIFKEDLECRRLDHMPTHISKVLFVWDYLGNKINMSLISGFLGNEVSDGYLSPQLGFGILGDVINMLKY